MSSASRPYRSHKHPACEFCRQRKAACKVDVIGRKCRLCREKNLECHVRTPASQDSTHRVSKPTASCPGRRRFRTVSLSYAGATHLQPQHESSSGGASPAANIATNESAIIVGPVVAEDVQVLQQHLTTIQPRRAKTPYNLVESTDQDPVLYLSVPRRRKGARLAKVPAETQREIMQHVLGRSMLEVVRLYFKWINPSFPMLDEEACLNKFLEDGPDISPALACAIFAVAISLWNRSADLKSLYRPDPQYAWNLAVSALLEDFQAATMSTLQTSLLDLGGRPILSVRGNMMNIGQTVALAHSLGLNRNPLSWKISTTEKNLRVRIWWGILIHDRWASFAHGVPPNIVDSQYDVPIPTLQNIMPTADSSLEQKQAAESFIQLCRLSEILGHALPLIYDLRGKCNDLLRELQSLETQLCEWESLVPTYLCPSQKPLAPCAGTSNLHFGCLSLELLICRLHLRHVSRNQDTQEIRRRHFTMLLDSALAVADFASGLREENFREFWLPYPAHLLVAATTILLRCTVETKDETVATACKSSLTALQRNMHAAKDAGWDLENLFMDQCDRAISKVFSRRDEADASAENDCNGTFPVLNKNTTATLRGIDVDSHALPEDHDFFGFYAPTDSPGYYWSNFWDMLDTT